MLTIKSLVESKDEEDPIIAALERLRIPEEGELTIDQKLENLSISNYVACMKEIPQAFKEVLIKELCKSCQIYYSGCIGDAQKIFDTKAACQCYKKVYAKFKKNEILKKISSKYKVKSPNEMIPTLLKKERLNYLILSLYCKTSYYFYSIALRDSENKKLKVLVELKELDEAVPIIIHNLNLGLIQKDLLELILESKENLLYDGKLLFEIRTYRTPVPETNKERSHETEVLGGKKDLKGDKREKKGKKKIEKKKVEEKVEKGKLKKVLKLKFSSDFFLLEPPELYFRHRSKVNEILRINFFPGCDTCQDPKGAEINDLFSEKDSEVKGENLTTNPAVKVINLDLDYEDEIETLANYVFRPRSPHDERQRETLENDELPDDERQRETLENDELPDDETQRETLENDGLPDDETQRETLENDGLPYDKTEIENKFYEKLLICMLRQRGLKEGPPRCRMAVFLGSRIIPEINILDSCLFRYNQPVEIFAFEYEKKEVFLTETFYVTQSGISNKEYGLCRFPNEYNLEPFKVANAGSLNSCIHSLYHKFLDLTSGHVKVFHQTISDQLQMKLLFSIKREKKPYENYLYDDGPSSRFLKTPIQIEDNDDTDDEEKGNQHTSYPYSSLIRKWSSVRLTHRKSCVNISSRGSAEEISSPLVKDCNENVSNKRNCDSIDDGESGPKEKKIKCSNLFEHIIGDNREDTEHKTNLCAPSTSKKMDNLDDPEEENLDLFDLISQFAEKYKDISTLDEIMETDDPVLESKGLGETASLLCEKEKVDPSFSPSPPPFDTENVESEERKREDEFFETEDPVLEIKGLDEMASFLYEKEKVDPSFYPSPFDTENVESEEREDEFLETEDPVLETKGLEEIVSLFWEKEKVDPSFSPSPPPFDTENVESEEREDAFSHILEKCLKSMEIVMAEREKVNEQKEREEKRQKRKERRRRRKQNAKRERREAMRIKFGDLYIESEEETESEKETKSEEETELEEETDSEEEHLHVFNPLGLDGDPLFDDVEIEGEPEIVEYTEPLPTPEQFIEQEIERNIEEFFKKHLREGTAWIKKLRCFGEFCKKMGIPDEELGVDDTRMDLSQFDEGGRTVPSTPLQVSPPEPKLRFYPINVRLPQISMFEESDDDIYAEKESTEEKPLETKEKPLETKEKPLETEELDVVASMLSEDPSKRIIIKRNNI